jgi:hypothetical protein
MVPSRNFTVRLAPVDATSLAASRADARDEPTNELSATQSPVNSRRFSNLVFSLFNYTSPCPAPIVPDRGSGPAGCSTRVAYED